MCNTILRDDQIAYIFGHTMMATDQSGEEKKVMSIIGKKLQRTPPEAFYPMILTARIDWGLDGDNKYLFQTRANKSSAKTPIGMFEEFEIPNSLALVDQKIRAYYGLPENKYGY